ncbi:hypothetical protein ACFXHA_06875 [Nocardia sp. NPDC059240]|uniref:hypothetical protein n=1 Tax=Nocardia sp. NPDC059240 TaxID=3346786 RepID=UPI003695AE15
MRLGHASEDELRSSFDRVLAFVLEGRGVPSDTGLDDETEAALWAVARAHPNASADLVEAARRAFAGLLDGSNTARWRAARDRRFAEREAGSARRYRDELLAEGNRLNQLHRELGTTPEGSQAFSQSGAVRKKYIDWLPELPVARSPFTDELVTWPIDNVDLDGWYWNWRNPIRRRKSTVPSDWLCMGGAMRLTEPLTAMPFDFCMPGPDVPYVVPRLLELPETRAVISQVPVGPHIGWAITYFTTGRPSRFPLENTWGAQEYDVYDNSGHWRAWGEHAQTPRDYSFELRPWLESGKLLWIVPGDPALTLRSGTADCPYLDLPGQRRMQMINNGTIRLWGKPSSDVPEQRSTEDKLRESFDFMLSRILAGNGFLTGSSLDEETKTALRAIARAYPAVTDELVAAARKAFSGQLDGSNAERWRRERDRRLTELDEQVKRSQ